MMIKGGSTVPPTVTRAPGTPAIRYPTRMEAFTAMAPGVDWAMAVKSIISPSSIQRSFSTKVFRIRGTMT